MRTGELNSKTSARGGGERVKHGRGRDRNWSEKKKVKCRSLDMVGATLGTGKKESGKGKKKASVQLRASSDISGRSGEAWPWPGGIIIFEHWQDVRKHSTGRKGIHQLKWIHARCARNGRKSVADPSQRGKNRKRNSALKEIMWVASKPTPANRPRRGVKNPDPGVVGASNLGGGCGHGAGAGDRKRKSARDKRGNRGWPKKTPKGVRSSRDGRKDRKNKHLRTTHDWRKARTDAKEVPGNCWAAKEENTWERYGKRF